MERAFDRIKPGEEPPPPPPELLRWVRETTYGMCAGMLYGAASAHFAERALQATSKVASESTTVRRHRLWTRTITDTTLHGVRLGSFVSVFSAARLGFEKQRGERDMWNTVGAGMLTASLTGLSIPGPMTMRLQGAGLGLVVGGAMTVPLGYALDELEKLVPEQFVQPSAPSEEAEQREVDRTGLFIEQMEEDLAELRRDQRKKRWKWLRGGDS